MKNKITYNLEELLNVLDEVSDDSIYVNVEYIDDGGRGKRKCPIEGIFEINKKWNRSWGSKSIFNNKLESLLSLNPDKKEAILEEYNRHLRKHQ
ncbi:MAG: hypothetical protein J6U79_04095 [Paludibacteraceae bacterium]|nr:hypothetical protein [Paludibacteraceae bacterium]